MISRRFINRLGRTVTTYHPWIYEKEPPSIISVMKADPACVALNYINLSEKGAPWYALLKWIEYYENYVKSARNNFVRWVDEP